MSNTPGIDADSIPLTFTILAQLVTDDSHVTEFGPRVKDGTHLVALARIRFTHGPIEIGNTAIFRCISPCHKIAGHRRVTSYRFGGFVKIYSVV